MILDVGNVERIENPSAEQVEHYLGFMPPQSPFVILDASDDRFIQAAPGDEGYRVEYREEGRMYFVDVPFEQAVKLFEAYRSGDESFKDAVPWRPLRLRNVWVSNAMVIVLIALLLCVLALGVWSELR
jgi:hypothetical protein